MDSTINHNPVLFSDRSDKLESSVACFSEFPAIYSCEVIFHIYVDYPLNVPDTLSPEMGLLQKLRSHVKSKNDKPATESKNGSQDSLHANQSHPAQSGDEPYSGLTEVAAPEPVERSSHEELSRHKSLEQLLSNNSNKAGDGEDQQGVLCEVAAPEPVERRTEAQMANQSSLEQSPSKERRGPN